MYKHSRRNLPYFWDNVQKTDCCWLWTGSGSQYENGYGRFSGFVSNEYAHRAAWRLCFGEIPQGLLVLHECDTPLCVKPKHLSIGTYVDNRKDCLEKGRGNAASGKRVSSAILTEASVLEIRKRYAEGGITQVALGREYGVDSRTISQVVTRRNWSHV